MNLLARLVSPSSTKRLYYLHPVSALCHCDSYSTKATSTVQKTPKSTKPKTQKSSGNSYSFAQTIKKQAPPPPPPPPLPAAWPKPQPIPYQLKAANFVNLIGNVTAPVKFETNSDGEHFSTTVISLGNEGSVTSLSIPVIFGGDLAHIVACHVKENDFVFVSGQMSEDTLGLVSSEILGKLHIVAYNINFVVGFEKSDFDTKVGFSSSVEIDELGRIKSKAASGVGFEKSAFDRKVGFSSPVEIDELGRLRSKDPSGVEFDGAKGKKSSIERPAIPLFEAEAEPKSVTVDSENVVSSTKSVGNNSWESGSKKKDADQTSNLWSDLVKNPLQWCDYRSHKANGMVKEKFPDFKKKGTGESLWISSGPKWILPKLRQLQFDVKEVKPRVLGGEGERKQNPHLEDSVKNLVEKGHSERKQNPDLESSWKKLVENPQKWWDNRGKKISSKSPDFRHKETGECLWLNRSPEWVLSKLPSVKGGQNTA